MPRIKLTDRFVASAKAVGDQERTEYFDTVTDGLVLRVSAASGLKAWYFTFTSPRDGKWARTKLGAYPAVALADARGRALEAATAVAAKDDPRNIMRAQAAAAMTVAALIETYVSDPEKAALRSIREITRRLRRNVVSKIGAVRLSELRRRDVRNVTEALARRGAATEAARVFEDVHAMLQWAVDHEYIDHNPIGGMAKPASGKPRERVLSEEEIAKLWRILPAALARSRQCQHIIRLCLVTGQRVGEVAGITRAELDLTAREWRLPGSRVKNKRAHSVPLSDIAIAVIKDATGDVEENEFLFPCGAGHLSGAAVARTIVRAHESDEDRPLGRFGIAPWSAHDLRRTCLDGMSRLGVAPHVIGAVANHRSVTKATVTFQHYVNYDYAREKREGLDLWADRLSAIVSAKPSANVLPLRSAQ
jgi:integrase